MIIIIEGMDRCGKDSLIKFLSKYLYSIDYLRSVQVLHYTNLPIEDKQKVIEASYVLYTDMFEMAKYSLNKFHLIMNRAHLGEWVYGYIYRNYEAKFIYDIELHYFDLMDKICLITLVDSSLKCLEREDGRSLSKADRDKGKIECERFIEATNLSYIKDKLCIDIKNKSIDEVQEDALNFIKKK